MQRHNTLFLSLKIFSATGGIEKICKIAGKALYESAGENVTIFSMYDEQETIDTKYFPSSIFKGFGANKLKAVYGSIKQGIKSRVVILSHINLLSIGFLIKKISPKTKLVLFAHGIEIWKTLPASKIKMLNKLDLILAVSNYTKEKMLHLYDLDKVECKVLNNCLDPFLAEKNTADEQQTLLEKYNLSPDNFILTTVTRIAADEKYKGHEKVLEAIKKLITEFPYIRYLIVGKYDISEKERLDKLIEEYQLKDKIIFTGFVPDEELAAHYKAADMYVMPSKGEGFGIVFIEAMFYGLPVIAGNVDGSVDPLCNGRLGQLVNPDDVKQITTAIRNVIQNKSAFIPDKSLLMQNFSYTVYKENLRKAVEPLYN